MPRRRGRISSIVGVSCVLVALSAGLVPPAGASTGGFFQFTDISIPDSGNATPYPSTITLSAGCDTITDVDLGFNGFTQTFPEDVDILLVGPGGQNAIVMSDTGDGNSIADVAFTLNDEAATPLPGAAPIVDGSSYQPTNIGTVDTWGAPAPAPSGGSALSVFDGTNPNGTWSLFVVDDFFGGGSGTIGEWFLRITSTRTSEICIPGAADSVGPAAPYPDTTAVSGLSGTVTDVNLILTGVSHTYPDDMDILLVGPGSQNAIVTSDVGGGLPIAGVNLTLDDEAASSLPVGPITSGSYKPTNNGAGDTFDPPAPTPSGGSALSVFDGTNPNGTWSLFVDDNSGSDVGRIDDWSLQITHTGFNPTFSATGGRVKEGKRAIFHVGLSAGPIIPFDVPFATQGGSAKAGKDFKSLSGNLTFAPGETSKSVVVKTKNDPKDEKKETLSVQLTTPTGPISATGTIKDNDR